MSENQEKNNSGKKEEIEIKISSAEDKNLDNETVFSEDSEGKNIFKKESSFADISLKKKFRLSDFLAEKIITSIAFLSIAVIILIFIFVFRESLPMFLSGEEKISKIDQSQIKNDVSKDSQSNSMETPGDADLTKTDKSVSLDKPEQYGVMTEKPEQYGVTEERPEQYGVTEERPEQYGVTALDPNQNGITTPDKMEPAGETSSFEQGKISSVNTESSGHEGTADFKNLTGTEWQPVSDNPRYGLLPLFLGTFKLTLIAILIAAPIGILAALFTASFAPKWLKEIIKPAIEILAGFPSVVIGFFALMVMATFFQDLFGYSSRLNAFVGGVAMSLAAIPIIYTITEDALTAVPKSYKEASLALGATTWQTAFFVTLPAATPGIFAAVLLGVGRVFGETMIALMATGNASLFNMNPFDSVRALSATIGAEMAEVVFGDTHYNVLFLIGSLLFIFTFVLNVIAEFYVRGKLVKRFQGGKA